MPLDKIYGANPEGIGDVVVVGVPGWGCFENSVAEGGGKSFTKGS